MSLAMLVMMIITVLVYCGLLQRVLDRMHLSDRAALVIAAAMLAGTFLPDLTLGPVRLNIGGAVIPLGVCIWLMVKADEARERLRALAGLLLTGIAVFALTRLLPAEAEQLPVEPMLLYGAAGGVIAWLLGRSRRAAFICGVGGMLLADVMSAVISWQQGSAVPLVLGGAGIADAMVVSGVLAVLLCELVGETVERIVRRRFAARGGDGT